jgi:hypothetical protein
MTDIARIPKHFSENGMHFYFNTPISKNLIASFKCPLIGRDQNNIDIDIPQRFFCFLALHLSRLGDTAIDELFSIRNSLIELLDLYAFVPRKVQIFDGLIVEPPLVEVRLRVTDNDYVV